MSYETFQMEKYGNILKPNGTSTTNEFENGLEQQEKLTEWFEQQAELELIEKEK